MISFVFQGVEGAYTHQAIEEFCSKNKISYTIEPTSTFRDLFEKVNSKNCVGMIPIENSTGGSVVESYDLFFEYRDIEIIAEMYLEINHCLIGSKSQEFSQISTVISHPQALLQCSEFIYNNNLSSKPVFDTAGAVKMISEDELNTAAIASEFAAFKYGQKILLKNIQDTKENTTRFLLVKQKSCSYDFEELLQKPNKTTLVFETNNVPAALYKSLGGFATNSINLTKIESRPKKNGTQFKPIFFIDCEASKQSNSMRLALEELDFFTNDVRVLGSYPKG